MGTPRNWELQGTPAFPGSHKYSEGLLEISSSISGVDQSHVDFACMLSSRPKLLFRSGQTGEARQLMGLSAYLCSAQRRQLSRENGWLPTSHFEAEARYRHLGPSQPFYRRSKKGKPMALSTLRRSRPRRPTKAMTTKCPWAVGSGGALDLMSDLIIPTTRPSRSSRPSRLLPPSRQKRAHGDTSLFIPPFHRGSYPTQCNIWGNLRFKDSC